MYEINREARGQLIEIAFGVGNETAEQILTWDRNGRRDGIVLETEREIQIIRDLAAIALEGNVPEMYGFDQVERVYDETTEILFEGR